MALSKQTHVALIALFLMLANKAHSQDTTSFAFDTFDPNPKNLTYQEGAHVPDGTSILRLTEMSWLGGPSIESVGRVVYSKPVHLWERSSSKLAAFQTTIRFVITPSEYGAADGIAFFIAPDGADVPSGSTGGNLGIFNSSGTADVFAVEFDTYANGWDPSYRHIGIDINSRTSKISTEFDSGTGEVMTAFISYQPDTKAISVVAASCSQYATLNYTIDLKTILPEWVQVGISSSTGLFPEELGVHDIHSWYFTSTLVSTKINDERETYIRQYTKV